MWDGGDDDYCCCFTIEYLVNSNILCGYVLEAPANKTASSVNCVKLENVGDVERESTRRHTLSGLHCRVSACILTFDWYHSRLRPVC